MSFLKSTHKFVLQKNMEKFLLEIIQLLAITLLYIQKKIIIGDNCLIAPFVYIIDHDHDIYNKNQINKSSLIYKDIIIEPNVWICNKIVILKGSIIRGGAVIEAGSVVKGEILNNAIFAGNPEK